VSRVVSDRFSSSSWNGGVTDAFRISSSWHSTSIWPLRMFGFSVPSGRRRTLPVIRTQNSLRTRSATWNMSARSGSQTTWARPSRSRRSMKMTPPWSRRRWTQPKRVTTWSSWSVETWPV